MANLDDLRQRATDEWEALQSSPKPRILVGTATCGRSAGALEAREAFEQRLKEHNLDCHIIEVGCIGLCYAEPIVCIIKPSRPGIFYRDVTPERAAELVDAYLAGDDPLPAYALGTFGDGSVDGIPPLFETPVFKPQVRRTLRNCGFINPSKVDHYLANGGYTGLTRALAMSPEEVIEEIKNSGLRGRGGAGFPTWRKWQFCKDAEGKKKYVICNGSEGDPGTFSNKLLFESDPHSVLEGMLLAAYAVGAGKGYVYCPAEYPLALERLRTAIGQMREYGLLGEGILGSSFNFDITLKVGAGAYICGEETALIECIEGGRGFPRLRPPFPPVSGLWNGPTIINNVETLACVTLTLQYGAGRSADLGTEGWKGTKLVCLSGNARRSGVFEVPFGISLQQIVNTIGGGAPDDKGIKAVQTGGPGGGCLPSGLLDTPLDQDSLLERGSSMGSGGVVVMDESTCMVDIARNSLEFAHHECCGQCVPCRLGVNQLLAILTDITEGNGKPGDIEVLTELAEGIKLGSFCGLGQTAPNPMQSVIRYFRDEFEAHIREKRCPSAVCKALTDKPADAKRELTQLQ